MPLIIAGARLRNLVSLVARIASIFRSIAIVIAIAVVFLFGVATTVYLSLRSPEVKVPDVVGKDRFEAERILADADLKFRVRATRPSNEAKPDTVLFQLPRAGEVVKTGQTVAMDISRAAKEGESPEKRNTRRTERESQHKFRGKQQREQTEATAAQEHKRKRKRQRERQHGNTNRRNVNRAECKRRRR